MIIKIHISKKRSEYIGRFFFDINKVLENDINHQVDE